MTSPGQEFWAEVRPYLQTDHYYWGDGSVIKGLDFVPYANSGDCIYFDKRLNELYSSHCKFKHGYICSFEGNTNTQVHKH